MPVDDIRKKIMEEKISVNYLLPPEESVSFSYPISMDYGQEGEGNIGPAILNIYSWYK